MNSLPPALPPPWNSLAVGQVGQVAEPKNGREEQQGAQGRQDLQKRQAEPVQRVEGKILCFQTRDGVFAASRYLLRDSRGGTVGVQK